MQEMAQGRNILLKRTNTFGITGRYLELSEENLRYCSHCKFPNKNPTFTPRHCHWAQKDSLSGILGVDEFVHVENVFRSGLFPCTYAIFLGA